MTVGSSLLPTALICRLMMDREMWITGTQPWVNMIMKAAQRLIMSILDHPDYDADTKNCDFTLIKMKMAIDFALHPHIRPICLPTNDDNTYSDYTATVSGWGALVWVGVVSNTLQRVDVKIISNSECGGGEIWLQP